MYSDIAEFLRRTYKFFRRRAWHCWFAANWGLFERRFKSIIDKLGSHCSLLDKEAAALHFLEMKKARDARQQEDEDFERQRQNRMAQEVFAWLSAGIEDSQEDHLHQLADIRQLDTCDWILGNDEVRSWMDDAHTDAILWMTGIPGAGKSILSGLLVENLHTRMQQITLYYFCGQKASIGDRCASVLRTLAVQLLRQDLDMAPLVHQAYLQKGAALSMAGMRKLLKELLSNAVNTHIILDGIDECDIDNQSNILKSLFELQKHAGDSCRVLVSSRDEPLIRKALSHKPHLVLDQKTTEGLNIYIKTSVEDLRDELDPSGFDSFLFERLENRLKNKAKGMFLWVRLVANMLKQQTSETEFEMAIEQLPEGLDEAYGTILGRIRSLEGSLKDRALRTLSWICVAFRPVRVQELADGITLRPGQTSLTKKTRINDVQKHILDICAPLVQRYPDGTVDLVHFTAKEYVLHEQSGPFTDLTESHFAIAFSCVANLRSALVLTPRYSAGTTESQCESMIVQGDLGLHEYSHNFWAEHLKAYLDRVPTLGEEASGLMDALDEFAKVRKDYAMDWKDCPSRRNQEECFQVRHLSRYPLIHALVRDQFRLKNLFERMAISVNNVEVQMKWKLTHDETFLSLIDKRVRDITERLLSLNPSHLPEHIDKKDFDTFIDRFGFVCRFHGCTQCFRSQKERNDHEKTHFPSFPCLQCNFFEKGFRSRQALNKHTQQYHMRPEDFEIPTSLHSLGLNTSRSTDHGRKPGTTCSGLNHWNDEGERVLKKSLRQVVSTIQNTLQAPTENETVLENTSADQNLPRSLRLSSKSLEAILVNVEEGRYQTLSEFESDIRQIPVDFNSSHGVETANDLETMCDHELEQALKDFPAFSTFGEGVRAAYRESEGSIESAPRDDSSIDKELESENSVIPLGPRGPYWSLTERRDFPRLVEKHGRDFLAISNHMATKSPAEVQRYFFTLVESDGENLLAIADRADAERASRIQLTKSQPLSETNGIIESGNERRLNSAQYRQFSSTYQTPAFQDPPLAQEQNRRDEIPQNVEAIESANAYGRPKYERKPPDKVRCAHCDQELYSQEGYVKHYNRYHKPMRSVWICVDVSPEKDFFAKCKPCKEGKTYKAKHNALNHLRKKHFNTETTLETLAKWLKKSQDTNRSYKPSTLLDTRDRTSQEDQLHPIEVFQPRSPSGLEGNVVSLPSIWNLDGARESDPLENYQGPEEAADETSSGDQNTDPFSDFLLPDVSFGDLVSGRSLQVEPYMPDPSFIRPEHVEKLSHLNEFQRAVC